MLESIKELPNMGVAYLSPFHKRNYVIYWSLLIAVAISLALLPVIRTTISVTAQGITRPEDERTDVKTSVSGVIDSIFFKEGSHVKKGEILARIKDKTTLIKKRENAFEIEQHEKFIQDLLVLTKSTSDEKVVGRLGSPLYREQLNLYLSRKSEQDVSMRKTSRELEVNKTLARQHVISEKELFDSQVLYDKAHANYAAFLTEQQNLWQQDLNKYRHELSQYHQDQSLVISDALYYEIKAPVSGAIQNINTRYAGGFLQSGETLCAISPDGTLIGECYLSTKNIGLVKVGQSVNFQIDAFNYNYFGIITGKVATIDNDFATVNNNTIFKVRCTLDRTQFHLKNGFSSQLQKGLTFQAHFILGERTLWQLLWDKVDDWLNPSAPTTI